MIHTCPRCFHPTDTDEYPVICSNCNMEYRLAQEPDFETLESFKTTDEDRAVLKGWRIAS